MSWKCDICFRVSPPGVKLRKHILYRTRGEIAAEIPVCEDCQRQLDAGKPLSALMQARRPTPPPPTQDGERPQLPPDMVRAIRGAVKKVTQPDAAPSANQT